MCASDTFSFPVADRTRSVVCLPLSLSHHQQQIRTIYLIFNAKQDSTGRLTVTEKEKRKASNYTSAPFSDQVNINNGLEKQWHHE